MATRTRRNVLASIVMIGAAWGAEARAQFPIFYGGEVLTPFGQRGSDGSYLSPSARKLNNQSSKKAAKPKTASTAAVTPAAPAPTSATKGGLFGKRFHFWRSQ